MDRTTAINDRVTFRAQGPPQAGFRVQMRAAILRKGDNLQPVRALDGSFVRLDSAFEYLEQGGLPATVRTHQADANTWRESQVEILEKPAPAQCLPDAFGLNQALGLSIRRREIDMCRGDAAASSGRRELLDEPSSGIDSGTRFAGAGFRPSTEPLYLSTYFSCQGLLL